METLCNLMLTVVILSYMLGLGALILIIVGKWTKRK